MGAGHLLFAHHPAPIQHFHHPRGGIRVVLGGLPEGFHLHLARGVAVALRYVALVVLTATDEQRPRHGLPSHEVSDCPSLSTPLRVLLSEFVGDPHDQVTPGIHAARRGLRIHLPIPQARRGEQLRRVRVGARPSLRGEVVRGVVARHDPEPVVHPSPRQPRNVDAFLQTRQGPRPPREDRLVEEVVGLVSDHPAVMVVALHLPLADRPVAIAFPEALHPRAKREERPGARLGFLLVDRVQVFFVLPVDADCGRPLVQYLRE
mmetsp:Transcript_20511/g.39545  ORF Transcript_20511/g.39545 Transcript_20511/m.39545 type:complete len:262 (+) Transcript_20511:451-1236(+)